MVILSPKIFCRNCSIRFVSADIYAYLHHGVALHVVSFTQFPDLPDIRVFVSLLASIAD